MVVFPGNLAWRHPRVGDKLGLFPDFEERDRLFWNWSSAISHLDWAWLTAKSSGFLSTLAEPFPRPDRQLPVSGRSLLVFSVLPCEPTLFPTTSWKYDAVSSRLFHNLWPLDWSPSCWSRTSRYRPVMMFSREQNKQIEGWHCECGSLHRMRPISCFSTSTIVLSKSRATYLGG